MNIRDWLNALHSPFFSFLSDSHSDEYLTEPKHNQKKKDRRDEETEEGQVRLVVSLIKMMKSAWINNNNSDEQGDC